MEKRFCPVIGRTINIQPGHEFFKIKTSTLKNPCANVSKTGICVNYFSGCCTF